VEYQLAIQQTKEQSKINYSESTIQQCWYKTHYYFYWNEIVVILFLILEAVLIIGGLIWSWNEIFD
jgi:hypothetical protein